MHYKDSFDVIVIGAGHAGVEAALAPARMGCNTLLLTHNIDTIGQMSCNPAIGGIGKSHLVKEVDALGGIMAQATDRAGIQFRVLNRRKGPAVRATRAQADRLLYKQAVREAVENQPNLVIFQQAVDEVLLSDNKVKGVVTQMGVVFQAPTIVLCSGTFLGGVVHIGLERYSSGRAGDPAAKNLAQNLREQIGYVERLKTGTPPRIDSRSVDFSVMQTQPGDKPLPVMSYLGKVSDHPKQVDCFITRTNEKTHEIIFNGLDRSPLYTGVISGEGPRYCPSIEDKVKRFADQNSHQIFIEPEGLSTYELYPNGISTSLPFDVQVDLVRSIQGLENAHITRPGYAIEYDFFNPQKLHHWLESRRIEGLFLAGQINGTTGYEEAAAQGLLAGLNAALKVKGKEPWYPKRDEAYLGVMVDDLISHGTHEPYRMFTSRAEYRLLLREDNADRRLTEIGWRLGLVDERRWKSFCEKNEQIEREEQRLRNTYINPEAGIDKFLGGKLSGPLTRSCSLEELLRRPEIKYEDIAKLSDVAVSDEQVIEQIEVGTKYAGYIARQKQEVLRLAQFESSLLPQDFPYQQVGGLSSEIVQKLTEQQPKTLGQASRIPGVTPAAISILLIYLKKGLAKKS